MAAQNAIAIRDQEIQGYLSEVAGSLANYHAGDGMNGFLRSAMLMISESEELKKCLTNEAGKKSLYHAMKYAAGTGLSLNPQEGRAALIAYGGKVQYQVMKNGLIDLAMQSGKVRHITSDTVRENDGFDITKGVSGDSYTFSPARKNRGGIDGFFAAIVMTDGSCHIKYMTKEECEAHRDSYSSLYKNKPQASPWSKSFEGMSLKTVMKALFRNLSISPEMDNAVGSDDKSTAEVTTAEPRNVTPEKGSTPEEVAEDLDQPKEEVQAQKPKEDGGLF